MPHYIGPVRDDKHLVAKLKIFKKINRITFADNIINDIISKCCSIH